MPWKRSSVLHNTILTPLHSSLPPSTAPSGPVEALAATCGSTARLKWGVCGVSVWAQMLLFKAGATSTAVTTAGANSTVIVKHLFNEDRLSQSVTYNDGGGVAFPLFTFA